MRKAINSYMFEKWDLEDVLILCKKCNINYISLCLKHIRDCTRAKCLLDMYNILPIGIYTLFLDVEKFDEEVEYLIDVCKKAMILEAQFISIIFKKEQKKENLILALKKVEKIVKEYQLKVLLEPMNKKFENDFAICGIQKMEWISAEIDKDTFYWVFDTCHLEESWENLSDNVISSIACIHIADKISEDLDIRGFPNFSQGLCRNVVSYFQSKLFDGFVELEVISPEVYHMEPRELIKKINDFSNITKQKHLLIIGELAIHEFVPTFKRTAMNEELVQVGGGAAMILRQLACLGIDAQSLTISGDDQAGEKLSRGIKQYSSRNIHLLQSDAISSQVKMYINEERCFKTEILPGTVNPEKLLDYINLFDKRDTICYCPFFPGYQTVVKELAKSNKYKVILDLGYYEWCGNKKVLLEIIEKIPQNIYLVLINGKDMSIEDKNEVRNRCIYRGYQKLIITDGYKELWGYENGKNFKLIPEYEKEVCTCGAGDVLVAGIMAELFNDISLENAVQFGMELSRKKVAKLGI